MTLSLVFTESPGNWFQCLIDHRKKLFAWWLQLESWDLRNYVKLPSLKVQDIAIGVQNVKPVLSRHPRGICCSVNLIHMHGVCLIQVLLDNIIWGDKCHSNEQWKRLEYCQRLWWYTFALISSLKGTNN